MRGKFLLVAALLLAGCKPSYQSTSSGGADVLQDDLYTLYSQPSFVMATVPDGTDPQLFWDELSERVQHDSDGATTISRLADGKMLRVVYTKNDVPFAYHYAIFTSRAAAGSIIRLQVTTSWHQRSGRPDITDPMLAADATGYLSVIKQQLSNAAASALK